jgi:hypothetical protein
VLPTTGTSNPNSAERWASMPQVRSLSLGAVPDAGLGLGSVILGASLTQFALRPITGRDVVVAARLRVPGLRLA